MRGLGRPVRAMRMCLAAFALLATAAGIGCEADGADRADADTGLSDAGTDAWPGDALAREVAEDAAEDVAESRPGLLIVTTAAIRDASALLPDFVAEKERAGLRVRVAVEDEWGGAGLEGVARATALRTWLAGVAADFRYLLLIGDGHPRYGDVPMITVWPRHAWPSSSCGGAFALDCRSCETDAMYADLDGDWDLDGDGLPGEHGHDDGAGGIDFEPELIVGRIPVYFADGTEADRALEHAIARTEAPDPDPAWRTRLLLPAAWYYFKGQRLQSGAVVRPVDGADVAEWVRTHLAVPGALDVTFTRMYEADGVSPSAHASDVALSEDALIEQWNEGAGMVFWLAHGLPLGVSRMVWSADDDKDGAADDAEIRIPPLLTSESALRLDGTRGAFVVAASCEVGSADVPGHLAHRLLLAGGAVGMVASSSVTPGDATDYPEGAVQIDPTTLGATNGGVRFFEKLLAGRTGAQAWAEVRLELGTADGSETYAARMMLNYFGDPTLRLF